MKIKDIYKETKAAVEAEMEKEKAKADVLDAEVMNETEIDEDGQEVVKEEEKNDENQESSPGLDEQRKQAQEALLSLENNSKMLLQRVKNMKVFIILSIVVMVIACAFMSQRIFNMQDQVDDLEDRIVELEGGNKEEEPLFESSKYALANTLDSDMTKHEMFTMDEGEYDVLFYSNYCYYCEELDKTIDENQDKMPENFYFFNTKDLPEDSDLRSTSAGTKTRYEVTEDNFKYPGTPTLARFKDGKAKMFVGAEAIMEELGLTE